MNSAFSGSDRQRSMSVTIEQMKIMLELSVLREQSMRFSA
jgi:hypothetical protein